MSSTPGQGYNATSAEGTFEFSAKEESLVFVIPFLFLCCFIVFFRDHYRYNPPGSIASQIENNRETIKSSIITQTVQDFCESCSTQKKDISFFHKKHFNGQKSQSSSTSLDTISTNPLNLSEEEELSKESCSIDEDQEVISCDGSTKTFSSSQTNDSDKPQQQDVSESNDYDLETMTPSCQQASNDTASKKECYYMEDGDIDSEDGEANRTCHICLDNFQVGQEVSWSKNVECCHVFHHECILSWLETKHTDCPCCRHPFINDSENKENEGGDMSSTSSASSQPISNNHLNCHSSSAQQEEEASSFHICHGLRRMHTDENTLLPV